MDAAARDQALVAMQEAARAGGRVLMAAFAKLDSLEIRSKGPADFVSEADLASEQTVRAHLQAADPDAAWLGEETGATAGSAARQWVVDPLDGTTNFLCGIPHFSVSIALRDAGQTVAGVVYQPLTQEMFAARLGGGATRNKAAMRVSARAQWEQAVIATGIPHRGNPHHEDFAHELAAIRDRVGGVRRFGSAALDLAWVAWGRYDGFWERRLQPWDVDAGILLVREAGGVVTGLDEGVDPDSGVSLVAGSAWMQPRLRAALRGPGTDQSR